MARARGRPTLLPMTWPRATAVAAALALAGCGAGADPFAGAAPIGTGPLFQPGSLSDAVRGARPVGTLSCEAAAPPAGWAHVELFGRGRVIIIPPGIGVAPPRTRDGAYVRGGRCRYPLWTDEPTGLIALGRDGLRLRDLFAIWGRPLGPDRLAGFRAPVTAHVDGEPWTGHPGDIPLRHHAQIVLQAGGPLVEPHASYTFPESR